MAEASVPIEFAEYADDELPELLRVQVLDFQRIVWPEGFAGANRFRTWTSHPSTAPIHQLYAAGSQLVSHLEIVTVTVTVDGHEYRAVSPTAVLTYPAFRREGWSTRLNARAVQRIDRSTADIGLLTCSPELAPFYGRVGWTLARDVPVIVGPEGRTWQSEDVLLTRAIGSRSRDALERLQDHPLRIQEEW
ncbi:GNAT family N-acetyltransferase [Desertihabitans aurantiacus]|uniref:GNAT family N-acetyltransferase n=1 Tax=Desertihabitans aurantiacus TaxID=2282477 RepID=UPI000DF7F1DB|nr:GNAT family N-acetyltransferase [Desertihabitans aurantiacus]